jgi:hypothetical protein
MFAFLPVALVGDNYYNGRSSSPNSGSGNFHLIGNVDFILYDKVGSVKDQRHIDNMIVDSGVQGVASRIAPHDGLINSDSPYNYIALGTGNTPVFASETALVSELPIGAGYSRQHDGQATYTATSTKQLILSVTFPPGQATGTINESGLFNAATGGDMLARQTFSTINKGASDSLTVTWTITLSTTP